MKIVINKRDCKYLISLLEDVAVEALDYVDALDDRLKESDLSESDRDFCKRNIDLCFKRLSYIKSLLRKLGV